MTALSAERVERWLAAAPSWQRLAGVLGGSADAVRMSLAADVVREAGREALQSVDVQPVGRDHPQTSQEMARRKRMRSGTQAHAILRFIARPSGATDYEVEDGLGIAHQSCSGTRSGLESRGLVQAHPAGVRRVNRYGNEANVYVATMLGESALESLEEGRTWTPS